MHVSSGDTSAGQPPAQIANQLFINVVLSDKPKDAVEDVSARTVSIEDIPAHFNTVVQALTLAVQGLKTQCEVAHSTLTVAGLSQESSSPTFNVRSIAEALSGTLEAASKTFGNVPHFYTLFKDPLHCLIVEVDHIQSVKALLVEDAPQRTSSELKAEIHHSAEYQTTIRTLLQLLTIANFDSISDCILEIANQSTNGPTLKEIARIVFCSAIESVEGNRMRLIARLCRKIQEHLSPDIKDASLETDLRGSDIWRKYLLNWCQETYEAVMSESDESGQTAPPHGSTESDVQNRQQRCVAIHQLTGELYMLNLLTARIMREIVQKLLSDINTPRQLHVEALVALLTVVGKRLEEDNPSGTTEELKKSRGLMSVYFERIQAIRVDEFSPEVRQKLQDLLRKRRSGWRD